MTEEERKKMELQKQQQNQTLQTPAANTQQQPANTMAMQPSQQSQTVAQAQNYLQSQINKTAQTPYTQQVQALYQQMQNRPRFEYNMNADQEWQNYKNLYAQMGQKAMEDTVAQINQSTGGYGNSYAGAVGQQQYQGYLGNMLEAMPQFSQQAYDRYTQEGDELRQNAQLGMDAMQKAYGMAVDQLERGITPDDYLLMMSGLTQDQANQILKPRVQYVSTGGGTQKTNDGWISKAVDAVKTGIGTMIGGLAGTGGNTGTTGKPGGLLSYTPEIKAIMDKYNYDEDQATLLQKLIDEDKKKEK